MRTMFNLLLTACSLACLIANWQPSSANATDKGDNEKTITARRIVLVDENGNQRVTLLASNGASGIWVTNDRGQGASIYTASPHQGPTIALMDESRSSSGWPLALSLDDRGKPFVQVIDGGFHSFDAKVLAPKK